MVDHVKLFGYKVSLAKALVLGFSVFLFFWVANISQFNILRTLDFESIVIGYWLIGIGLALVIEGLLSIPDAKRGRSKVGGILIISFGFVAFAFASMSLIGGVDMITEGSEARLITTVLLFAGSVIFLITLLPELINRKTFVKALN